MIFDLEEIKNLLDGTAKRRRVFHDDIRANPAKAEPIQRGYVLMTDPDGALYLGYLEFSSHL